MRPILLLTILLICSAASAQVFKRTGPDGKTYFSDRPGPDAEQVEISPVQTITLPPVPQSTTGADSEPDPGSDEPAVSAAAYSQFSILSPTQDQPVRANNGDISVRLSLQPELQPGHRVELMIDGEDGADIKAVNGLTIELRNLSRGRHSIEAWVVGPDGKPVVQAGPVEFHVLRVAGG